MLREPGGMVGQVVRRLELCGQVRELEMDPLELGDGTAELFALRGVRQRLLEGPPREPEGEASLPYPKSTDNL